MAAGDVFVYNDTGKRLALGDVNFDTDTFKIALYTVTATVNNVALVDPYFDVAPFTSNQVTGTNYTAGGETLATTNFAISGGGASAVVQIDNADTPAVSWTQHATGPNNIRWGVLYDDTPASNKPCICYITFGEGADISLQDGDITFTFNATDAFTITRS